MAELERLHHHSLNSGWVGLRKVSLLAAMLMALLAISIVSPYAGIAALALLVTGMIFGINLQWALLGMVFLLPFDPQVELKPGFYLYFDLFFLLPSVVYFWKVLFSKLQVHWAAFALAPYVIFAIATTFWRAENLFWFAGYSVRLVIAVLFVTVIAGLADAATLTLVLGASLVPQVLYGFYQLLVDNTGELYVLIYPHYEGYAWTQRARGFFFTENNLAGYCAIVSVMLLILGLKSTARPTRIACYALASFGFFGVAIAGSRGAWIASFAGLLVLFFFSRARLVAKIGLATAAVIGALVSYLISVAPWARVDTLDTLTVDTRTSMYLAALLLFVQHPIIGVGLTNYQELMSSVINWTYGAGNAAHNTYLQILSENGIVGFLLFFAPIFYLYFRNLKRAKESVSSLLVSASLTVFLVHGLFDFQLTAAPQYLFLFAILVGLATQATFSPVDDASVAPNVKGAATGSGF